MTKRPRPNAMKVLGPLLVGGTLFVFHTGCRTAPLESSVGDGAVGGADARPTQGDGVPGAGGIRAGGTGGRTTPFPTGDGVGPVGGSAGTSAYPTDGSGGRRQNTTFYVTGGYAGAGGSGGGRGGAGGGGAGGTIALGLRASPSAVDFGAVDVGQTSPTQLVTITNALGPAALSARVTGPGFTMASNTCPPVLDGGARCTIGVRFTPTSPGGAAGTLMVDSMVISLTGLGTVTSSGGFAVTDLVALGTLQMGQSATALVLIAPQSTVANLTCKPDGADLVLTSQTCPASGPVSAPCTYTFTFTAARAGAMNEGVICSASGKITRTAVTATVVGASLSITPGGMSIDARVGTQAASAFVVTNSGDSATGPLTVVLVPATSDFSILNSGCTQPLPPLATCKIAVAFSPAAPGMTRVSLIVTDAVAGKPLSASLTGDGIPGPDGGATPTLDGAADSVGWN